MGSAKRLEEARGSEDYSIDQTIGHVLRGGMYLAAAVILAGGIMFLYKHGGERPDYHTFHKLPGSLRSPVSIAQAAFHGGSMSIMQLGMLLLIATPIARVMFSLFAFAVRKDKLYIVISGIVLCVLLYSLILP